jgi:hypothetical protein
LLGIFIRLAPLVFIQSFRMLPLVCGLLVCAFALRGGEAAAQVQAEPGQEPSPAQPDTQPPAEDSGEVPSQALSSLETGSTELDESFTGSRRERIRDQRRKGFEDTVFNWQLRTQYIDRVLFDGSENEAWALAASGGFKTGYFRDLIAFGATGYTSQPLYAPADKDGTLMLAPGQKGYTVLGEAYAQVQLGEDLTANLGRKIYDTPYINRDDIRMTPQTFEAATLQGAVGGGDQAEWRYGVGYFDKEKQFNSEDFVSMARVAGASVSRGVYLAGVNYKQGEFSLGVIDYYSQDIINIAYTEARYGLRVGEDLTLKLSAQYSNQTSVGGNLLAGTNFSGEQFGVKVELPVGAALLTTAYTSTGNGANMQGPWSGYPGYTRIMVQNFNRAGENALLLRAAYAFTQVPGLSAYVAWVHGSAPRDPTQFARDEYNFDTQWSPPSGSLQGLMFRFRYAYMTQTNGTHFTDFRLMLYFTPPSK